MPKSQNSDNAADFRQPDLSYAQKEGESSSAQAKAIGNEAIHGENYGLKEGAPSAPSSFKSARARNTESNHGDNYSLKEKPANGGSERGSQGTKENWPHSKKVRGTLGNTSESAKNVNKTMLGDPASLTSETSETHLEKNVERGDGGRSGGNGKSKL